MISKRDYYIGLGVVAVVVVLHACLPRYVPAGGEGTVLDRWTGTVCMDGYCQPREEEPTNVRTTLEPDSSQSRLQKYVRPAPRVAKYATPDSAR